MCSSRWRASLSLWPVALQKSFCTQFFFVFPLENVLCFGSLQSVIQLCHDQLNIECANCWPKSLEFFKVRFPYVQWLGKNFLCGFVSCSFCCFISVPESDFVSPRYALLTYSYFTLCTSLVTLTCRQANFWSKGPLSSLRISCRYWSGTAQVQDLHPGTLLDMDMDGIAFLCMKN